MIIKMFNFWYFFWIFICVGFVVGTYFLLRNKSDKTKNIVLMSLMIFCVVLHFLKVFIPPYSIDLDRMLRDAWFVNICGANILLYPFFFLSKKKPLRDYMFYLGVLGGLGAVLVPLEPIAKADQLAEQLDIIRFYIHHIMLFAIPLLMILLKLHKLSYKRVIFAPLVFLGVMAFIMLNQVLQAELGFIPMRGEDIFDIHYKNSSLIWAPPDGQIGKFLTALTPGIFRTIPFGQYAGQQKFWPLFWLIVPLIVFMTPVVFLMSLIFDFKNFKEDFDSFFRRFKKTSDKQPDNSRSINSGK